MYNIFIIMQRTKMHLKECCINVVHYTVFKFCWKRRGWEKPVWGLCIKELSLDLLIQHLPTRVLFLVRTPTQSEAQDENLDQAVSWQSSWHGSWQDWVSWGIGPAKLRQAATSAGPPSNFLHETAGAEKKKEMPDKEKRKKNALLWVNTDKYQPSLTYKAAHTE